MANGTVFFVISEKRTSHCEVQPNFRKCLPEKVILPEFTKCPECFAFRKFNNFGFSRKLSMEFSVPFCRNVIRLCMLHYMCGICNTHTFYFCRWSKNLNCADAVNKRERTRTTPAARAVRRWINTPAWCKSYYR